MTRVVICPVCERRIPCPGEMSCVLEVPQHIKHGNVVRCEGSGKIGFVVPGTPTSGPTDAPPTTKEI